MSKEEIVYLLIEGGRPLELIKRHIAEKQRVYEDVKQLAKELGVNRVQTGWHGTLAGVMFEHAVPPDWKKPSKKHGVSYPKKGTYWARRLAEQKPCARPSEYLPNELGIPIDLEWKDPKDPEHYGGCRLGPMLNECGFLWLSHEGPFCMWIPDVEAAVNRYTGGGRIVDEPAASWKPVIAGTRQIEKEDWEMMALQHKLADKKAAKESA